MEESRIGISKTYRYVDCEETKNNMPPNQIFQRHESRSLSI